MSKWGDPRAARGAMITAAPELRARGRVASARAASVASSTVRVGTLSPASARQAGVAPHCPTSFRGVEVVIKSAPVLAEPASPMSGLVLSGQHIAVTREIERGSYSSLSRPTRVVEVWADEGTLRKMHASDWEFVVGQVYCRDVPVPAYVSSHLRCLAFYDALAPSTEMLTRWAQAIKEVDTQIEVLGMLFPPRRGVQPDPAHVDLAAAQVIHRADPMVATSWMRQARTIAKSAKAAHRKAQAAWVAQEAPAPSPSPRSVSGAAAHFTVRGDGGVSQDLPF